MTKLIMMLAESLEKGTDAGREHFAARPEAAPGELLFGFPGAASGGEKAMTAVIREACIQGVSTCSVDELMKAMGMTEVSQSQASRLCKEISERVAALLARLLDGDLPKARANPADDLMGVAARLWMFAAA